MISLWYFLILSISVEILTLFIHPSFKLSVCVDDHYFEHFNFSLREREREREREMEMEDRGAERDREKENLNQAPCPMQSPTWYSTS